MSCVIFDFSRIWSQRIYNKRFSFQYVLGKSLQWSPDNSPGESLDEYTSKFWVARLLLHKLLTHTGSKQQPLALRTKREKQTKNTLLGESTTTNKNQIYPLSIFRNLTVAIDFKHNSRAISIAILS